MQIILTCPLCGSEAFNVYPHQLVFHTCKDCGLVYMAERPTDDEVWDFYHSEAYYQQRLAAIEEHGRNASHEPRAARVSAWICDGKSHLDVGCAEGYLLRFTKAKGFDVMGVEPYPGYTFDDIPTVRSIDDVEGQWDNITCIHVLEHVSDFKHMAHRMVELLEPGGFLIIEVPGIKAGTVVSAEHLYYYPPSVIKGLFSELTLLREFELPNTIFFFTKDVADA